jgi:hypothetical protein
LLIGREFDVLNRSAWDNTALPAVAATAFASAPVQELMGLACNSSFEFMAQRFGYPRLSCQVTVNEDMVVRLLPEKVVWSGRNSSSS